MKFRAHDTFFIRKGWLSKGMRNVKIDPAVFMGAKGNPMDILGIGANMVKALRYWLQAVKLTTEPNAGRREQSFTPFGEIVFKNDPYIEEMGTLWFLHYMLASNKDEATAWYFFYNEFKQSEFNKEDFVKQLSNYIMINGEEVSERSLEDDYNCIINTYAQYMYTTLLSLYQEKENETRQKLEQTVNEIFKSIYNGGFSLSIDEKYNIQVIVNEFEGVNEDVETSTAQSISVIFAFIAGVIKMARQSQNPENEMLVSEPYPLVMDAPLSAFDKARIRTVCDALPNVAEQVIIFIKDTDGELAETYMGDKVGSRFEFDKKNEFETNLVTR